MLVKNVTTIVKEKISTEQLNNANYISTDNMLPNYSGITLATSVPNGTATQYHKNDILLSNIRPYFKKVWFADRNGGCNADIICIRVSNEQCIPQYLYYQLITDNFINNYVKACKGAKMPRGDLNQLLEYDFYCPSYEEQLRITNILGSIDKKIEINKKKIEKLEAIARDVYDYWFVQYEFPDENGKPYKSNGGIMRFNTVLNRAIPQNWVVCDLHSVLYIVKTNINPKYLGKQLIEHYSIPSYDENKYPAYDVAAEIESGKFRVYKDSILVSKLNPQFKRIWDPLCMSENAICSTEFIVYRPIKHYYRTFAYALLNSEEFYSHIKKKATSSTGSRKRIDPDICSAFKLALPPEKMLKNFFENYSCLYNNAKDLLQEIHMLLKHKANLLPLLMNGQAVVR